jgi:hypothetical protein
LRSLLRTFAVVLTIASAPLHGASLFVATNGLDTNPGTESAPFRSLSAARDAARRLAGREAVTVRVGDGVHYLPDTLVFTPADSGAPGKPVIYEAANAGRAILSGGSRLSLTWRPFRDGILQAATPAGIEIDQLFVNGTRQRMARYPNYDAAKPTAAYQGFAADAFSKERAAGWKNPAGGYIHAMHVARWGGYHYRITGKDADGNVTYEGGWQNNRRMGMHKDFRMVENVFEELDAPGEWFHDRATSTLYFFPEPGTDAASATIEVVRLRHLVECRGSANAPVRHLTLSGFVFRHAARTFMDTREPLLRSDWAIYRGGVILADGTEDLRILDCEFDQPGGNAVFFSNYNRRGLVRGCHIHGTGASGVCFVGNPRAVRNPLFEYGERHDLATIDRTPGPKSPDYPSDCAVEDCLIQGVGRVERQPAGVQISMSQGITVRDTTIHDCARSGINISEGTWGGHLIERCDVFDTVLETHDHGSFNSWGRDRYWISKHRDISQPAVREDPRLPFLDAMKPTVIRHSRWRCDHGWDIDLDDGSSNYEIHHNLLLQGGLKFREGFGRSAYNNVIVNNGFHPHVWFEDSGDGFHSNIVMRAHAAIGMPNNWGTASDRNFFSDPAALARARAAGADANSTAGDPRFLDPARGDFRVADDSPALAFGFQNFAMDQFGVKKPALRARAGTPRLPEVKTPQAAEPAGESLAMFWLGARLHGLEGEEFSAFGVTREDGGVQLADVPALSPAANAGLRRDDLVQGVNGRRVTNVPDLFAALAEAGDSPITLRLVRAQQPVTFPLPTNVPRVCIERAGASAVFPSMNPPATASGTVAASQPTRNDPLPTLVDGRIAASYGPVFANGTRDTAYRVDLGAARTIHAITSWSHRKTGDRMHQVMTVYGSNSESDPGWDTGDTSRFTPIGSIDTTRSPSDAYLAASIRGPVDGSLGTYRWIVWRVIPPRGTEHTAFQEFSVSTTP